MVPDEVLHAPGALTGPQVDPGGSAQKPQGRMNAAFRTLLFGGGSLGGYLAGAVGVRAALTAVAVGSALAVLPVLLSR